MLKSVKHLKHTKESFEWGVVGTVSDKLIGTCELHSFSKSRGSCKVGCLLNRRVWGQGIMFEALGILFSHARTLSIKKVSADIDAQNTRSQALFNRLGFKKDSEGQHGLLFEKSSNKTLNSFPLVTGTQTLRHNSEAAQRLCPLAQR